MLLLLLVIKGDFSNRFSLSKFRVMISQLFSDDLSEHASVNCWKKQSIASIVQCGQLMTIYQYSRVVNRDLDIVMDSNILFLFLLFLSIFLDLIFLFLFFKQ